MAAQEGHADVIEYLTVHGGDYNISTSVSQNILSRSCLFLWFDQVLRGLLLRQIKFKRNLNIFVVDVTDVQKRVS